VRRAGIIYASSRGLTRRLKCQTRRDRGLARPRGRLSSPPPRDLNSGKTSRIGDRKTDDASAARDKGNEERPGGVPRIHADSRTLPLAGELSANQT